MSNDKTLTEKMIEVQDELKAPKNLWNKFSSFYYRNAESILEAAKPLNAEKGLLLSITDEPVLIGDWHYIKATASVTDGKDNYTVSAYAREDSVIKGMAASQITGSASSYARKYALNGLYLIDDTKDADTDEYQQQNKSSNNQSRQANKEELELMHKKANELAGLYQMDPESMKQKLGVRDNHTEMEYKQLLKRINDGIEKAGA